MIDVYSEIRKRYGNVRRARGYYLYTEKNIRLLDLWLDGGKAILGRRAGQAQLVCKQFLDRGLTGGIPTKADRQLRNALAVLLPDYPVIRYYESEEKAQRFIRTILEKNNNEQLPVWRPFLGVTAEKPFLASFDAAQYPIILVTPAYPVSYGIIAAQSGFEERLPPSDPLFPPLAYSLARAFFDLQRNIRIIQQEAQGADKLKKRRENLKQRTAVEKLLPAVWNKTSYYLFPHISEEEYPQFFSDALDNRVLISPDYRTPSLLPDCGTYTELLKFLKTRTSP